MNNKKILIVDDDPDARRGLHVRLKANHYETLFASDGITTIAEARKHQPDLIILDLGLPAGDGFAVMDLLSSNDALSVIPIIVVSGRDRFANKDKALQAGAWSELAAQVSRPERAIFNLHVPPARTAIDKAPALDATLKPVVKGGAVVMQSVGSEGVLRLLERYQPMLGLHGHIHESRGIVKLGRTMCANPGSEYTEGILRGFLADLDGDKIKSYLLTSG